MDNIKTIILDNQTRIKSINIIKRDISFDMSILLKLNKIITISGPRRAGKTYFMMQILKELSLDAKECVFLDFSEITFSDFSAEDFPKLYSAYCELYPSKTPWFFLDEIQEINNFEKGIKYLQNRGCKIFISGSSAKLFSQDIASILRGKTYIVKVPPLSFFEYLRFKNISIKNELSTKKRAELINELEEYLYWGGFPEVVLSKQEITKKSLIKSYIEIMLFRDIIERYSIRNSHLIEILFFKLIKSFTKEISINKWFNDFKSAGLKISKDTLFQYIKYFEDSQYIKIVQNRSGGATSFKKTFLADNGLYTPHYSLSPDKGKLFENLVLQDLTRTDKEVYFTKNKDNETDFIVENRAIQVCYTLTDDNIEREVNGLSSALKLSYIHSGTLISIHDNRNLLKSYKFPTNCSLISYLEFYKNFYDIF